MAAAPGGTSGSASPTVTEAGSCERLLVVFNTVRQNGLQMLRGGTRICRWITKIHGGDALYFQITAQRTFHKVDF